MALDESSVAGHQLQGLAQPTVKVFTLTEAGRQNNIGFLRLLFATLVIVSHSAEMIDGNRSREALTSLMGIITFGELAVNSFFIISGYLIVQSFERSRSIRSYLSKRLRRIFPGFLVAYFVCVYLVGPLAGVDLSSFTVTQHARVVLDALQLKAPAPAAFLGLPYPVLNGAMWSIAFEFRCYLLVIGFATFGLYRRRYLFLALTLGMLLATETGRILWLPNSVLYFTGDPTLMIRMLGLFCAGSCFYLFREAIPLNPIGAAIATTVLILALSSTVYSHTAIALAGGYLVFWFGFLGSLRIGAINSEMDISYGVYLYAWPIQGLIIFYLQVRSPWLVTALAIPISFIVGYLSWTFIEKGFIRGSVVPVRVSATS